MAKFSFRILKKLPHREKKITLPTWFTFLRIVLAPFIVTSMVIHQWGLAFVLFCIASATDVIDGNLARYFNEKTFLGACLDPVADKILLLSCFFTLAFIETPLFSIPLWFVILVLCKELIIIAGSAILYLIKGHLTVQPTWLGKSSTVIQVWFIIWLFACYFFKWVPLKTYYVALSLVTCLVILSFIQYIRIGFKQLSKVYI